jgi:predicted permease
MRWWRRKDREAELERELHADLELEAEELRERGLSEDAVRFAARRALGNTTRIQEDVRTVWGWRWASHAAQDVKYALRTLRTNPGFASVAVAALALGVGANTAIYSIVNAVYLRMLPVERPEEVVAIGTPASRGGGRVNESFSYPLYAHLRDHSRTLAGVIAHHAMDLSVATEGATDRVRGALVSGNYFSVLGVRPVVGTAIEESDDVTPRSGGARGPVAVLSYGYWMRRFGGDPAAVGRTVELNGSPFTIAGVAPPGFGGTVVGDRLDVFAPLMMEPVLWPDNPNAFGTSRNVWLRILGRLGNQWKPAEAELTLLLQQFNQAEISRGAIPEARRRALREQRVELLPASTGRSVLRTQLATALGVVAAVAGLVLLIACANVANLLLTRATGRRREIAVRLALGASRGRLVAQLLTESMVLAVAGSLAGILLARWVRDLLMRFLPQAAAVDTSFDSGVMTFNLALGVLAGVVFGLAPAMQSANADLAGAMKSGGAADRGGRFPYGKALVAAQVALSLLLLSSASIFVRSLGKLEAINPGFSHRNVLVFWVDPRLIGYSPEQSHAFFARLMERLRAMPGVIASSRADFAPLGNHTGRGVYIEGYQPRADESASEPAYGTVAPGYFETLGIPLVAGRGFDERDDLAAPKVAIVNETFARYYFAGENPIGRRMGSIKDRFDTTIVGIAKDGRYSGLREAGERMVYMPAAQVGSFFEARVVHLRTGGDPAALEAAARAAAREIDPHVPVYNMSTVQQEIDRSLAQDRLVAALCSVFSGLALCLAAVGLYGVMSYWVSRRVREIGIRLALGATRAEILGQVIGEALRLLAAGVAVGLPAAYAAVKLVATMLYGVEPGDPASAAVAVAVLGCAALVAAWIPARRAARLDPMTALRYE